MTGVNRARIAALKERSTPPQGGAANALAVTATREESTAIFMTPDIRIGAIGQEHKGRREASQGLACASGAWIFSSPASRLESAPPNPIWPQFHP
ncbi:MAG: hypothetical protein LBI48_08360 [Burkholderiaceae bacterium]|jgi:hypothetical protein|nr:hypothetical protein [Burkholderiaceae bacterium]